jgi:hypothetical protein
MVTMFRQKLIRNWGLEMNLNLTNLVAIARSKGGPSTTTASSWRAVRRSADDTWTDIFHYSTLMFSVNDDQNGEHDTVIPWSKGWGSMSDKKGVRKILTNVNGQGYAEVYKDFV